jgi:hypothetical protein
MKINKEMAEHLIRYHTEYETTRSSNRDIVNIFVLLKYIMNEIEKLETKINANKPEAKQKFC